MRWYGVDKRLKLRLNVGDNHGMKPIEWFTTLRVVLVRENIIDFERKLPCFYQVH